MGRAKVADPYKSTRLACYSGYFSLAICNNLAPLLFIVFRNEFHISYEMIGRLVLINFCTQFIVDFLTVRYADRIGYRLAMVISSGLSAAGLIGLGILPGLLPSPYLGLVIAVLIYSAGGGLIEVLVSPIVESLPGDAKAAAMSFLHSFYCWGQASVILISTLVLKIAGLQIWHLLPVFWAVIPLCNIFAFLKVPLIPPLADHEKIPVKRLLGAKIFVIAMLLMLCAGAAEITMSQWASLFAEKGLKISKVWGDLLGPCLFAVLMGIGRLIYGFKGHHIKLEKALLVSGLFCMICYATAALSPVPTIALIACASCGLAISLLWPGIFSLTAAIYPKGGTAMFGILALSGDLGCSLGPWLAGWISDIAKNSQALAALGTANGLNSDQVGLKTGLLMGILFPAVLVIGIIMLRRMKQENGWNQTKQH